MDNFDNNNMGGFEPQKPFTEKPVQNNNMNTEQTIPVPEPETQEEQTQNVQPQNGNTPYGDYIFGNNNQNTANNASPTENVPPYQQNQNPNPYTIMPIKPIVRSEQRTIINAIIPPFVFFWGYCANICGLYC